MAKWLFSALRAFTYKKRIHSHSSHFKIEKMNGTFFLIPQREFENTFNNTPMESILTNRLNYTDDEKSMEDSVPENRSECLIWWVKSLYIDFFILSHASFSRNNGAKKHFNKFHANTVLSQYSNWNQMTSREREEKLIIENRSWKEFIRLIE